MAFDAILKQKMKVRHKYGFKPPKTGRRSDVEGEATVSVMQNLNAVVMISMHCCALQS